MNNELVSIIVPIYNTETYLENCIDSLINQTYDNIEIILVNDGSTDNSLDICLRYEEKHSNICVINQCNQGVSAARNSAIRIAKGQYLIFVDSDDQLIMNAVEKMYGLLVRYDADIVSAGIKCDSAYKSTVPEISCSVTQGEDTILLALEQVSMSACAKLFKKCSIDGVLFAEGKKINEDGFFVFECYLRKLKVVETDEIVYLYSRRQGSASRTVFTEKYLDMLYFLDRKMQLLHKECPHLVKYSKQLNVRTHLNLLQLLCNSETSEFSEVEKFSCHYIRNCGYVSMKKFLRYERRVYCAVRMGLYPLYKFMVKAIKGL